jgi:AraC family transcriptional regulator
MMDKTSAEMLEQHIAGRLVAGDTARSPRDALAQIFARNAIQDSFIVPAVAEPLLVCFLTGSATVEERSLGGEWTASDVGVGDFFVTDSDEPYELRWQSHSGEPFEVMHLYLGLPMLERAANDVAGISERPALLEVSGARDPDLERLVAALAYELTVPHPASALVVESIAQAIAVHLVRGYRDPARRTVHRRNALPAFRLRRVTDLMQAGLAEDFSLARCAATAEMSEAHFSRQFKRSTGFAPSQYFIRLRIAEARRLLRETERSIISIGMDVGYSSPSHFAQVFRKGAGVSPSEYRGG